MKLEISSVPIKSLQCGFSIPSLGFGTWTIGGKFKSESMTSAQMNQYIDSIHNAYSSGVSVYDTAEAYGEGKSEFILGQALADLPREKLFVISKVWHTHLDRRSLINSCRNSLSRLKTDYLDLYLIHAPNPNVPISETMAAMNDLMSDGIIRNIGLSNFSVESFIRAQEQSKYKIVLNQVHYNLKIREAEASGLLKYCQSNDIILMAWRPIYESCNIDDCNPIVQMLCNKYGFTPAQLSVCWLVSQKNIVTISRMLNSTHQNLNIQAASVQMDMDDIEKLRNLYVNQLRFSDVRKLQ